MKNHKNEKFYSIITIKDDMEKITEGLKSNFHPDKGNYIAVKEFQRGIKNKRALTNLIKKINDQQPDYLTGKQKKENDYSGIYLFATKEGNSFSYQYVGISQQVINRLKQHICNSGKGSASWAFLMAKVAHNRIKKLKNEITRNNFKSAAETTKAILKQQETISKNYYVTYYPIDNNFLMHMVEPYVACDLGCIWNSFETH